MTTTIQGPAVKPWLSLHIHYTANPNPLLADCVGPLVRDLVARGLVERFFFIRYWVEGPHTRLRLLPSPDADPEEVLARSREAIHAFLAVRPAVYEVDDAEVADMYRSMFLSEYPQEEWDARYGAEGRMTVQPNNSIMDAVYEPEHDRYGGVHGLELSEWHFQRSSEVAISLVARTNMHLRTITFGIATQLMTTMAAVFVGDRDGVVQFFEGYEDFWARLYVGSDVDWSARYDLALESMPGRVSERIANVFATASVGEASGFLADWLEHCVELRARVVAATQDGLITFGKDEQGEPRVVDDPDQVLKVLLGSYLHMTNNRLGVTPNDESYLAHVIHRSLGSDRG